MGKPKRNANVVRRAYEAFNTGDIELLTEAFHEDARWHTPGNSPIAGSTNNRDETFAQFGHYVLSTDGTFKADLKAILRNKDGSVVGIHHNSAERNGKKLDTGCCIVFELKDGQIIDGREHFYDLHNWDAFWSE